MPPLQALAGYREIFGTETTLELVVYDRGGDAPKTRKELTQAGVEQIGIQPKHDTRTRHSHLGLKSFLTYSAGRMT